MLRSSQAIICSPVAVPSFKYLLNQMMKFHESMHKYHVTEGYPSLVHFTSLPLIVPKCWS